MFRSRSEWCCPWRRVATLQSCSRPRYERRSSSSVASTPRKTSSSVRNVPSRRTDHDISNYLAYSSPSPVFGGKPSVFARRRNDEILVGLCAIGMLQLGLAPDVLAGPQQERMKTCNKDARPKPSRATPQGLHEVMPVDSKTGSGERQAHRGEALTRTAPSIRALAGPVRYTPENGWTTS